MSAPQESVPGTYQPKTLYRADIRISDSVSVVDPMSTNYDMGANYETTFRGVLDSVTKS